MRVHRIAYAVMVVVAAACLAFAFYYRHIFAVSMYDSNLEAFHEILSKEHGQGIIRTARGQLSLIIVLLAATNLLWALGVGVSLVASARRHPADHRA